ncbi:ATP-dependent DNA helicase PIF1-like [Saccopteryx leptura]|uniref:ATP-dependent DNA helicase PIF1-like n=1 Tax=Saccopteryx leptura TaxID=249018 RepID=UPI00339D1A12
MVQRTCVFYQDSPAVTEMSHLLFALYQVYRKVLSISITSFDTIGEIFFLDAPGGTGKMFQIRLILAAIRSQNDIALALATSGIATTLLPGGRTAHSALKLPLNMQFIETPTCNISKASGMGKVLQKCKLTVWDEYTMAHKKLLEALDRSLQDLHGNIRPFGNALILLAGDFRQTLPVIPRSIPVDEINACLKYSTLWRHVKTLKLTTNMPKNKDVYELNNIIHSNIQSEAVTYKIVDTVVEADEVVNYLTEFLNSLDLPGMPLHILQLKIGVPITMLLNINQPKLCNGKWLAVKKLMSNVIEATILTGPLKGEDELIPHTSVIPTNMPFQFTRLQFPIRLAFAITINRAQGQSLELCTLDLHTDCFSHAQLYVACSRVSVFDGPQIRTLILDEELARKMNKEEIAAWQSFVAITKNFLGNKKAENYEFLVQRMLLVFRNIGEQSL